jgi:hypothetical protein
MQSVSTLPRPAGILIGCVLAVWPFVSASAQVVAAEAHAATAWSSDSQPNDANLGAVATPTAAPVGSREFVQQYVAEKRTVWQQRLKLSDWRIACAMARRSDLKPQTVGQIHWDKPSRSASILVLDPSDYRMPLNAMLDDMELTIIHELVHLKLTSLPHSEASRGSEEQAVNGISEALFALEHQKQ